MPSVECGNLCWIESSRKNFAKWKSFVAVPMEEEGESSDSLDGGTDKEVYKPFIFTSSFRVTPLLSFDDSLEVSYCEMSFRSRILRLVTKLFVRHKSPF